MLQVAGLYVRFCKGHNFVLLLKTKKEKQSFLEREPMVRQLHGNLRVFLASNGGRQKNAKLGAI